MCAKVLGLRQCYKWSGGESRAKVRGLNLSSRLEGTAEGSSTYSDMITPAERDPNG